MLIPKLTDPGILVRTMAQTLSVWEVSLIDASKVASVLEPAFRYNKYISGYDIVNYCAIHRVNLFNSKNPSRTKLGLLSIIHDHIDIEYAVYPSPENFDIAAPEIGKWKDLKFNICGDPSSTPTEHYEAFSGNDMIDLYHHVCSINNTSASRRAATMPEQERWGTSQDLKRAIGIPPVMTLTDLLDNQVPQRLCQNSLDLDEWGLVDHRTILREDIQQEPPYWIAPYLKTPHFSYELSGTDGFPSFRAARWIVSTEQGWRNLYMLYAAMRRPPAGSPCTTAWLPAPLPRKLLPHSTERVETLSPDTPIIIARDLHIEIPDSLLPFPAMQIRYPGSLFGMSLELIDWTIVRNRRTFLLLDAVTLPVASQVLALYDEILAAAPASLEIVWSPPPSSGGLMHLMSLERPGVSVDPEELKRLVSAARQNLKTQNLQNELTQGLARSLAPNSGSVTLLHGEPTAGTTALVLHIALAEAKGQPRFANRGTAGPPKRVLYVGHESTEAILRKLYNISTLPLPETLALMHAGDFADHDAQSRPNMQFELAVAAASLVILDSPEDFPTRSTSPWTQIFRLATHLKEGGKEVLIVTHSAEMPLLRKLSHNATFIYKLALPEGDSRGKRDLLAEFVHESRNYDATKNIKYTITREPGGSFLTFIGHPHPNNDDHLVNKVKTDNNLGHHHKSILIHLIKNGTSPLSNIKIGASKRTANNCAHELVRDGLIAMTKKGRATAYTITPDLTFRYSFGAPFLIPAN